MSRSPHERCLLVKPNSIDMEVARASRGAHTNIEIVSCLQYRELYRLQMTHLGKLNRRNTENKLSSIEITKKKRPELNQYNQSFKLMAFKILIFCSVLIRK